MFPCEHSLIVCLSIAVAAVVFIGFSKAGFGGGVGLLTTPLLSLILPAKTAIGFALPLMIVADGLTIYLYRRQWDWRNLQVLLPGGIVGIILGSLFIDVVSDLQLKRTIGSIVIAFSLFHFVRSKFAAKDARFVPQWWHGSLVGIVAGFVSTISHSAGAVIALYLIPQNLSKLTFVATMALFLSGINLLKLAPYFSLQLINLESLQWDLLFVPLIPLGTLLGVWLNKRISQKVFTRIIQILVLITGLQLLNANTFLINLLTQ